MLSVIGKKIIWSKILLGLTICCPVHFDICITIKTHNLTTVR